MTNELARVSVTARLAWIFLRIMREVIVEDDVDIGEFMTPAGEHSDPIDPLAPTQIPTRRPGG